MDDDPLDNGIRCDISEGCQMVVILTCVGAVVVAAALALSLLQALGLEIQ